VEEIRMKAVDEKFCQSCGAAIKQAAEICPKCGVRAKGIPNVPAGGKQRIIFIVLGFFLGTLGIHNFYAGYTTKGVIQLVITLTLGWVFGLGVYITAIWALIEIIITTTDATGEILY
jgi:TM2 domain-containing membrane protein YozV/ribosomal protein L40E